ncbi:GNAT family N-acetyltransferase [Microbulbifer sp. VAAC004]|uniref:GNAT family N-acetyltransferase n=1 Tax=unclassified Microbulbifer TaxID=2619833 RepID=UPI0040391230
MNERKLIEKFRKYFEASEVDELHRHESELLKGPFEPLIVHVDLEPIGCVDLRKPKGTVDGYVELAYIFIYSKRQGYGSIILNKICELADVYGLEVELDAIPIAAFGSPIPQSELYSFYRKYGFKNSDIPGSNMMTRYPNA